VRTSEVAQQADVNAQTLRYYERRGLLPEPARTPSGYRDYGDDAVRVVQQRIDELAGMCDALARLVETCGEPPAERQCPILHDIETAVGRK
jgi:DNA-binding transcriptional MerR regulator